MCWGNYYHEDTASRPPLSEASGSYLKFYLQFPIHGHCCVISPPFSGKGVRSSLGMLRHCAYDSSTTLFDCTILGVVWHRIQPRKQLRSPGYFEFCLFSFSLSNPTTGSWFSWKSACPSVDLTFTPSTYFSISYPSTSVASVLTRGSKTKALLRQTLGLTSLVTPTHRASFLIPPSTLCTPGKPTHWAFTLLGSCLALFFWLHYYNSCCHSVVPPIPMFPCPNPLHPIQQNSNPH